MSDNYWIPHSAHDAEAIAPAYRSTAPMTSSFAGYQNFFRSRRPKRRGSGANGAAEERCSLGLRYLGSLGSSLRFTRVIFPKLYSSLMIPRVVGDRLPAPENGLVLSVAPIGPEMKREEFTTVRYFFRSLIACRSS